MCFHILAFLRQESAALKRVFLSVGIDSAMLSSITVTTKLFSP